MLRRRELLLGAPLLAAAAGAFALTPRNRLTLLGDKKLEDGIPLSIGPWQVTPSNAVILPEAEEGTLAARLYDQTVSRLYTSDTELPVMLVVAYGSTQSDQLQLHRPETCYTAIGFEISAARRHDLPVGNGGLLPGRELVASSNERVEPIFYWTRIGDYLPASGRDQRVMKLRSELNGYIADGVLVRLSTVGEPSPALFDALHRFSQQMLDSMEPAFRPALVGRPLASKFGAAA
jgi:EpsI family protein